MTERSIAIIMPVLDEAEVIADSLRRLRRDFPDCELVVVDGGSTDATVQLAAPYAQVLHSPAGRAAQMNTGAAATASDVLWFIHADVTIDAQALTHIQAALEDPTVVGGGLTLAFDHRSVGLDYLAWGSNMRARHQQWIFGDQAIFVRRSVFDTIGGFPDLALMEDLELSRQLKHLGRLAVVGATCTASARRFEVHGTWPMIAWMQYLKALYLLGIDPHAIRRRYTAGPPSLRHLRRSLTWQRT